MFLFRSTPAELSQSGPAGKSGLRPLRSDGDGGGDDGRQARLVELDPQYVDTIILRWQEFSGGAAVPDGDGRSYEEIAAARMAAAQ